MKDHDKNILASRENWQSVDRNEVASSAYYIKCEKILKELAGQYLDAQMSIIDLGCADGKFTEILSEFCKHVTGYEYSLPMLERARQLRSSEKTSFYQIDLEQRNWSLPPCQAAVCMGVLTYIHEDSQMDYILAKIGDALKAGAGRLFITRESLSKTKTFRWMTQGKYYSIYRSDEDYYSIFTRNGFEFINKIKLFEDDYVINAFRLWQCKPL